MDQDLTKKIARAARNEITEHYIYRNVARRTKNKHNRQLLNQIADQELGHYRHWCKYLNQEVSPSRWKIWFYTTLTSLFGLSFGLKLMENGEELAQKVYQDIGQDHPAALDILRDEQKHEECLLKLINESFLNYVSSFVLGLSDALVELTGALAGLTLALPNTKLIGTVGLITGIAASMSMAASEYLSTKEEQSDNALKSAAVTGIAYFFTVILMITPYLVFSGPFVALASTFAIAILIIFIFTFYTSVAKSLSFKKRFTEMASISLGVAILNFFIGFAIKRYFGLDI